MCSVLACASGRRSGLWYPAPDASTGDTAGAPSPDFRGTKSAAKAIVEDEQSDIIAHVVRAFYAPIGEQARWIDPRPLAHLRSADDTVGSDPDWEDEIVAKVRMTKVCGVDGPQAGCKGKPGGVLRFSYPYSVGKDSAIVYATYSPVRDSTGKPSGVESEMQFKMRYLGDEGWTMVDKLTVSAFPASSKPASQKPSSM